MGAVSCCWQALTAPAARAAAAFEISNLPAAEQAAGAASVVFLVLAVHHGSSGSSGGAAMADLAPFGEEGFDPAAWVNGALAARGQEQPAEKFLAELEMRLQLAAEELEVSLAGGRVFAVCISQCVRVCVGGAA